MNNWLRIAIVSSCITSYMSGSIGLVPTTVTSSFLPRCSQRAVVTVHKSRGDAIDAELEYRGGHEGNAWSEKWMEWSGDLTRGVFLVHGNTVEQLTFKSKTKSVVKTVQEPDGEEVVIETVPAVQTPLKLSPKPPRTP